MEIEDEIVNKVSSSSLITINLEDYYSPNRRILFDLKDNLFNGMILREKDFREFLANHNWNSYKDANVAITCTEDAIIPVWAYMLVVSKLSPFVNFCMVGTLDDMETALFQKALTNFNPSEFSAAKVVIKGCSKFPVPAYAYAEVTRLLLPFTSSIMYGEPCSTVPIYKKPKI